MRERVVSVAGGRLRASGYVIADRLVLTCAHVTVEVGQSVQVFPAGASRTFTGEVVWRGTAGGRDDAALVRVADRDWVAPEGRGPGWGRLVTERPVAGRARGFPAWAQPDRHADTWEVTGTINPGSRVVSDQYVLTINGTPPAWAGSPWEGFSGAALFCGPLLTGVVVADVVGGGHGHLSAVPMSLVVADPRARQVLGQFGVGGTVLEPVELRELAEPALVMGQSPAALLSAHAQTVGFRGRQAIMQQLLDWCASNEGFGMWLWHAGGGQGKTRLAVELSRLLAARRWAILWLRGDAAGPLLDVVAGVTVPLLVVVDYAETRTELLTELLRVLTGHSGASAVRVLLLARTVGDWWRGLATRDRHTEHLCESARTSVLPILDGETGAGPDAYRQALTDLAVALAALPAYQGRDWTGIAGRLADQGPRAAAGGPVSVLTTQMSALADLLDVAVAAGEAKDQTGWPVEDRLLSHEHHWWWATAEAERLLPGTLNKKTLLDALSTAILFGAGDDDHADTLLRQLQTLADQRRDRRDRVQAWIGRLYPPPADGGNRRWGSLQPDRLAERAAGLHLQSYPRLPDQVLPAATTEQRIQLITVYTRAAAQPAFHQTLDQPLTDLIFRHPQLLAAPAVHVAAQVEAPGPLISALRRLTSDPLTSLDNLAAMAKVPVFGGNLAGWAVELGRRLVGEYRPRVTTDPDTFLPDLATALATLSLSLGLLGRWKESTAAIEEAVDIRRQLVAAHPDAFLPDLGRALNLLYDRLRGLGRWEDALAAIEEAVAIFRELASANPDTFRSGLGVSLQGLAVTLGELGRWEEAVVRSEEAVAIFRGLAPAQPEESLVGLATSLGYLAFVLGKLGRPQDCLAPSEEAVTAFRQLAVAYPELCLPGLAESLTALSRVLGGLGRWEEGLATVEEDVAIRRRLAAGRPDRFLAGLAESLTMLSLFLGGRGRREEGLAVSEEAVAVYRKLATGRPDHFLPGLAMALHNLALSLGGLGRWGEALGPSDEAVALFQRLAAGQPDQFLAGLAESLTALSGVLGGLGRREEALSVSEEADAAYRMLLARWPDIYQYALDRKMAILSWLNP